MDPVHKVVDPVLTDCGRGLQGCGPGVKRLWTRFTKQKQSYSFDIIPWHFRLQIIGLGVLADLEIILGLLGS